MSLQEEVYFSIVLLKAAWALRDSFSTSVRRITFNQREREREREHEKVKECGSRYKISYNLEALPLAVT
jgi:hypothetical protein